MTSYRTTTLAEGLAFPEGPRWREGRLWFTVRIGDHPTLESAEKQAGMFMEEENMRAFVRPYNAF